MSKLLSPCLVVLILLACGCSILSPAWPDPVVPVEAVMPQSPLAMRLSYRENEGRPSGTTVLRVHVSKQGVARNVAVASSSGQRNLDQAAVKVAWEAAYKPYLQDGQAIEVTALVPIHLK